MKTTIISVILWTLLVLIVNSQENVYTPKGHIVDADYESGGDYTDSERDSLDQVWSEAYPNAQLVMTYGGHSTTRLFNCHGYAWHVSEGGAYVWIGMGLYGDMETIYWNDFQDPSYISTPSAYYPGGKAYYSHNHSAVVANPAVYGQDWVVSKWGQFVLMAHQKEDCPWDDGAIVYYKLNPKMTGETTLLCYNVQRPFTTDITHMPSANFVWTKGSYLATVTGGGIHDYQYTVKGAGNGSTYVNLTFTTPSGFTWSPGKSFWAGKFENTVVTGQAAVCPNSIYTYTAQVPGGHSSSYSYSWTYPGNWLYPYKYQNTIRLQTPSSPNYGAVRVSITNVCGTSGYSGITVYPRSGCGGYFMLVPNPARDEVNIIINEALPLSVKSDSGMVDLDISKYRMEELSESVIRVYDSQGNVLNTEKKSGTRFSISTAGLKEGNYVIEVSNNKDSYRERLVIYRK
jgi:hypothetical protein